MQVPSNYPEVLSEWETMSQAVNGKSLSRFGDGELRIAMGRSAISQAYDRRLAMEMRRLLNGKTTSLVCIPNVRTTPNYDRFWHKYAVPIVNSLYDPKRLYGSAFVTRPDNAPWIDRPAYWDMVRTLWVDRDVTLVYGTGKSLDKDMLCGAKSVRYIAGPERDAYLKIDALQEEIGTPSGPVLMCLGACATVLAERLARRGVHALDLGHVGMFMRRRMRSTFESNDLISPDYALINRQMHEAPRGYGGGGYKHAEEVAAIVARLRLRTVLDYGCGEGTLKTRLAAIGCKATVTEYDPAVAGKESLPAPVDLVVCTDVLEHIEPEKLRAVVAHIKSLALRAAFVVVATRPSNKKLPDGREPHLIIEPAEWWLPIFEKAGFEQPAGTIAADRFTQLFDIAR